ncbi:PREDICTED: receptor-transporting protein 3-like [Gekko japonicus]|uniref:Receptor-transporting protein 3-like n=1 Tax=Gekko japonicus TaxID=146911 RepID=A0ABM1L425_GEKJA|nr:PREDICTED: receptor-transporting protein 3-like [Gekko japonicus]
MPRRREADNVQGWKERFVQLMKMRKPQDKWTLDVSDDLSGSSYGWYTYDQKPVFARFECSSCSKEWKSAQVVVRFHMRLESSRWGSSQGQVKTRLFGQRCRRCLQATYEVPIFSEEAAHKLLHNLVLKILDKCYGEPPQNSHFFKHDAEEDVEGPHDRDNCEACQDGTCLARPAFLAQSAQQNDFPDILGFLRLHVHNATSAGLHIKSLSCSMCIGSDREGEDGSE